jgi:hypothetical protein
MKLSHSIFYHLGEIYAPLAESDQLLVTAVAVSLRQRAERFFQLLARAAQVF